MERSPTWNRRRSVRGISGNQVVVLHAAVKFAASTCLCSDVVVDEMDWPDVGLNFGDHVRNLPSKADLP